MAPEAVAAERAYQMLKAGVVAGRFKPGETIVERVLAAEHGVSIAPLRDGAQRLLGEGLLEPVQRGGYRVPAISEAELRDLYQWHEHLVRLIVKLTDHSLFDALSVGEFDALSGDNAASMGTRLFRSIAALSDNREHARALLAANDRLQPVRQRESVVLANLTGELEHLRNALLRGSDHNRFAAIRAYHRRRIRRANKIIEALAT